MVEASGEVTGELEVLSLVFTDGDMGGAVEKDVGGLEDGVGEEAEFERVFVGGRRIRGGGVGGKRQLALCGCQYGREACSVGYGW